MYRQPGQALVSFDLPDTLTTHRVLSEYATGSLVANIRRFAACRNFLFKKLKEVRQCHSS